MKIKDYLDDFNVIMCDEGGVWKSVINIPENLKEYYIRKIGVTKNGVKYAVITKNLTIYVCTRETKILCSEDTITMPIQAFFNKQDAINYCNKIQLEQDSTIDDSVYDYYPLQLQ